MELKQLFANQKPTGEAHPGNIDIHATDNSPLLSTSNDVLSPQDTVKRVMVSSSDAAKRPSAGDH